MRVLIYTITFLFSGTVMAQVNNATPEYQNNSTNTNNLPIIVNEAEKEIQIEVVDSVAKIATKAVQPATIQSVDKLQKKDTNRESLEEKSVSRPKSASKLKSGAVTDSEAPVGGAQMDDYKEMPANEDVQMEVTQEESMGRRLEMEKVSGGFSSSNLDSDMQRSSRSPSYQQQALMDQAVTYFEVNAPASFEHHYFKYVAGNYDVSLYPDLKKAEEIRPDNADVHAQMAGYFMIENKVDTALIYIDKLLESDRLTDNVVAYAGDILRSAPQNGSLITHGFDDSYGSYYAQNMQGIRTDVTLISLDFLQSEVYREELKGKGYVLPASTVVDVDYLVEFCTLNDDKGISISMTTPKEYLQPLQDKLFVVGLVFEYHTDGYNNFTRNDYLWNESLEKHLISEPGDEKGKQLSSNYLPMLLYLQKAYEATGETEKLKEVDEVSDQVGVQCRKYEQVQKVKASY